MEPGLDTSPLVSTTWLAAHLDDPHMKIVDVRWRSRYENGRGVSFDDHEGYARSYYGHHRVRVLDGGLRKWQAEGRALTTEVRMPEPATFTPRIRRELLATKDEVIAALRRPGTVIVDCLNPGERHLWGQRPGHIARAVNVPYMANVDPALATTTAADRERMLESGRSFTLANREVLAALYRDAGVMPEHEIITYCGRAYAASCGLLALKLLGYERVRLYDGSWAEWSADPDLPAEISVWSSNESITSA